MNLTKRFFSFILVIAMFAAMFTTASAISPLQTDIQPRYIGIIAADVNLEISSSGNATVKATVRASSGYTVNLDVSLMRDSGTSVKSWSDSGGGTVEIQKNYYVTPGHDYYVLATISVFDQNGRQVDTIEKETSMRSY